MVYRYIPIVRWKRGERTALTNLAAQYRQDVVPLIVLAQDQPKGKTATKSKAAITPAEAFAHEVHAVWPGQPFYLDASRVPPNQTGRHVLLDIAHACRTIGAQLIPATNLAASPAYDTAVQAVVQTDGRGVGLRAKLNEVTTAFQWTHAWPFTLGETDLIVDLADTVSVVIGLGQSLDHAFQNLHGAGQWRTVSVGGSSMPENFGGYLQGLHTIQRVELQIWQQLTGLGLPYRIDFADYATVPTIPPPEGIAYGFPINARYTLPTEFLICRGVGTRGPAGVDMATQLIGHAQAIVNYPHRNRIVCWSDDLIDQIAAGAASPGNLETWVSIGINRHVALTRSNLP
jgi:hypothetical protein